jgi:Mg2+ and Co2+ transporter CorA
MIDTIIIGTIMSAVTKIVETFTDDYAIIVERIKKFVELLEQRLLSKIRSLLNPSNEVMIDNISKTKCVH